MHNTHADIKVCRHQSLQTSKSQCGNRQEPSRQHARLTASDPITYVAHQMAFKVCIFKLKTLHVFITVLHPRLLCRNLDELRSIPFPPLPTAMLIAWWTSDLSQAILILNTSITCSPPETSQQTTTAQVPMHNSGLLYNTVYCQLIIYAAADYTVIGVSSYSRQTICTRKPWNQFSIMFPS